MPHALITGFRIHMLFCQGRVTHYITGVSYVPGEIQHRIPVPPWRNVLQPDQEASKEHQCHSIWHKQGRNRDNTLSIPAVIIWFRVMHMNNMWNHSMPHDNNLHVMIMLIILLNLVSTFGAFGSLSLCSCNSQQYWIVCLHATWAMLYELWCKAEVTDDHSAWVAKDKLDHAALVGLQCVGCVHTYM
jgi:hypothetical protein